MNVRKNLNQSTVNALTTLLTNSLPYIKDTHKPRHLRNPIKSDLKGKAVRFTWNLETFRVTESLCVNELDFTNTWTKTEESSKVESLLRAKNEVVPVPA